MQKVIFDNLIGLDLHDNELYSHKRKQNVVSSGLQAIYSNSNS